MRVGVIGGPRQETNPLLVGAWCAAGINALLLSPKEAPWRLDAGDVALVRLDVRQTLDGIEPGLRLLQPLTRRGIRVLNRPDALIGAHDKLETARRLRAAGVPHPRWAHVTSPEGPVNLAPPVVVKPRFGSWGRDVFLCESERQLGRCLENVRLNAWFLEHGALVQELVSRTRHDLPLIVAGRQVVGAARRDAAPGEWRTNVSLGGSLAHADPDRAAAALAVRAVAAIGMDLAESTCCSFQREGTSCSSSTGPSTSTVATRSAAATLFSTPPPRSSSDRVVRRRCLRLLRPRASADHSCAS